MHHLIWYLLCFAAGQASILAIEYTMLRNAQAPKHLYEPQDH